MIVFAAELAPLGGLKQSSLQKSVMPRWNKILYGRRERRRRGNAVAAYLFFQILKARLFRVKIQLDDVGGAVAVFGNVDFGDVPFGRVRFIHLLAVDEHDHVRVLLDEIGRASCGKSV